MKKLRTLREPNTDLSTIYKPFQRVWPIGLAERWWAVLLVQWHYLHRIARNDAEWAVLAYAGNKTEAHTHTQLSFIWQKKYLLGFLIIFITYFDWIYKLMFSPHSNIIVDWFPMSYIAQMRRYMFTNVDQWHGSGLCKFMLLKFSIKFIEIMLQQERNQAANLKKKI